MVDTLCPGLSAVCPYNALVLLHLTNYMLSLAMCIQLHGGESGNLTSLSLQAGALTDNLIPEAEGPEVEDDVFALGSKHALRESLATRMCPIKPKWPEILKKDSLDSKSTPYQVYRSERHGSHVLQSRHGYRL